MLFHCPVSDALIICQRMANENIPFVLSSHHRGASISVAEQFVEMFELCRTPSRYPSRPLTQAERVAVARAFIEGDSDIRKQA